MSLEDRELERYARERQRGQGRKGMFNLEDDGDEFGAKDGFATLGTLTHGGRSVMNLPGDDFEAQGFGETEDEDHVQGGKRRLDGTELPRRNEDDPDVPEVEEVRLDQAPGSHSLRDRKNGGSQKPRSCLRSSRRAKVIK